MGTFKIAKVEISSQLVISLLWAVALIQINILVFTHAPKPFCEIIIQGSSAAIHTNFEPLPNLFADPRD